MERWKYYIGLVSFSYCLLICSNKYWGTGLMGLVLCVILLSFVVPEKFSRNTYLYSLFVSEGIQSIENNMYPRIKAISYWNEKWDDGGDTIDLTINSFSETVNIYKELISSPFFLTDAQYQYNEE